MELFVQILLKALENKKITVEMRFPDSFDMGPSVDSTAFAALCGIRKILRDDSLSDPECFRYIEAIVRLYEDMGLDCGNRHDFG